MTRFYCTDGWFEMDITGVPNGFSDIKLMIKRMEPRYFFKTPQTQWVGGNKANIPFHVPRNFWLVGLESKVVRALASKYLGNSEERVFELFGTIKKDFIKNLLPLVIQGDLESFYQNGIEKAVLGMCYLDVSFIELDSYLLKYYRFLAKRWRYHDIDVSEWSGKFIIKEKNLEKITDDDLEKSLTENKYYSTEWAWPKMWAWKNIQERGFAK